MKEIETIFATNYQGESNHAYQSNKKKKNRICNKRKQVTTFQPTLVLLQLIGTKDQ